MYMLTEDRLLNYCRVLQGQVCYHYDMAYSIYQLFNARYSLFKRFYSHRVGELSSDVKMYYILIYV
jgi:HD superfamily phosphohydrolase